MRAFVSVLLAGILSVSPVLAAQEPVNADVEAAAWREMASAIPLGSRVKVRTESGRRLTATLMTVEDDGIVVKRDARVPEPAVTIPYSEIAQLQREEKTGFTWAKALGIGLAAGVGAILTIFAIAVTIDD